MVDHGVQLKKTNLTEDIMNKICKISRGVDSSIFKKKKINKKKLLEKYNLPVNKLLQSRARP